MKVSAIVPVFNAIETLERAVDSLLIQPEISEVILIDDGSRDGSLELCQKLAQKNSIICVFQHPNGENKGAPASRNLGLKKSNYPWIQFMDADDELLAGKIGSQLQKASPDVPFIVGKFDSEGKEIAIFKDVWAGLLATRLGNTSSNLWNSHWVQKVGGWDESLLNVQEYHLMFELLKINEDVKFSDPVLVHKFPQKNSITNSKNNLLKKRDTYFQFRNKVREFLKENGKYTFIRKHYYTVCTGKMLKYHRPDFKVPLNKFYFLVYNRLKLS